MRWNGVDFTVDGREPTTAEEFHRIGLHCWQDPRHREAAAFFLEPAARAGHAEAAELLGHVLFSRGEYAAAAPWLRGSAGTSRRAAHYLGRLSYDGCPPAGITASYADAAHWYREAARLGEPEAMLALGEMYLERLLPLTGAPVAHALELFAAAAALGHPYAQFRSAELYRTDFAAPDPAARCYELCLANPATAAHPLGSLMTQQSRWHLSHIRAAGDAERSGRERDRLHPRPPDEPRY
ncbi:hypothetical protein OHU17_05290 [Streptomyces goshikiensis]|uniref:Sel1 repeat family protein n=1 Tax=Streptomyces goshikiensis TaxID=1942 RepID=A0ABZ1RFJ5_9ACTN|nr:hypothetical protein [Streptomyces goshikiensis]